MSSEKPRILIVDDQKDVADAVCRLLLGAGFEVETAYSPEDALSRVDRFKPAVVISDYDLGPMTGERLLLEIIHRRPTTRGLIVSGRPSAAASASFPFVAKPFVAATLMAAVRAVLQVAND
ncbi:MAG: response regulator [Myxococcaceae bacterium]